MMGTTLMTPGACIGTYAFQLNNLLCKTEKITCGWLCLSLLMNISRLTL